MNPFSLHICQQVTIIRERQIMRVHILIVPLLCHLLLHIVCLAQSPSDEQNKTILDGRDDGDDDDDGAFSSSSSSSSSESIEVPHQSEAPTRQLVFVQAVWRHGDRAPAKKPYPDDPYDQRYWPRGWNQLTNLGMTQMRELGTFLRQRYVHDYAFLSAKFNPEEVFVQSSSSDRALTSAQALLSGLFPAMDAGDQFDQAVGTWQPIPVHSTGPNHELLKPTSFECPAYERLKQSVKAELDAELKAKYAELFEFLRTVFRSKEPITLHKAAKLSNIRREIAHNLTQPEWVYRQWPQYGNTTTLELITELKRLERTREFAHPELAFLKGGFLLGDWIRRVETHLRLESPQEAKKALLYAMGLGDDQLIPYAACIMMEIWSDQRRNGTLEVEIYYRRDSQLRRLNLTECGLNSCEAKMATTLLRRKAIFDRQKLFKKCERNGYCAITDLLDRDND